jgi:vacuolar protein sorting-associated protein 18
MQLLTETDAIKIEDILPFFPDFVVIDEFKDVICQALQSYSQHINLLKSEMDEAGESAKSLKQEINELHKRFITLETSAKCFNCLQPLLNRQFYVFPCQHGFHADCLITLVSRISTFIHQPLTLMHCR